MEWNTGTVIEATPDGDGLVRNVTVQPHKRPKEKKEKGPKKMSIHYLVLLKEVHNADSSPKINLQEIKDGETRKEVLLTVRPEEMSPELELQEMFGVDKIERKPVRPTKRPGHSDSYTDQELGFLNRTANQVLDKLRRGKRDSSMESGVGNGVVPPSSDGSARINPEAQGSGGKGFFRKLKAIFPKNAKGLMKVFSSCCQKQPDYEILEETEKSESKESQDRTPETEAAQPATQRKVIEWCNECAKRGASTKWHLPEDCSRLRKNGIKVEEETPGKTLTIKAEVYEERCQFCAASSKEHGIFKCPRLGEGLAKMGFTVEEKEGSPKEIKLPRALCSPESPRLSSPTWPDNFDVGPRRPEVARRRKNGSSVRMDGIESEPVLNVTILKRPTSIRRNSSFPVTTSRQPKSYEQRKEEYAQARLKILGASE